MDQKWALASLFNKDKQYSHIFQGFDLYCKYMNDALQSPCSKSNTHFKGLNSPINKKKQFCFKLYLYYTIFKAKWASLQMWMSDYVLSSTVSNTHTAFYDLLSTHLSPPAWNVIQYQTLKYLRMSEQSSRVPSPFSQQTPLSRVFDCENCPRGAVTGQTTNTPGRQTG